MSDFKTSTEQRLRGRRTRWISFLVPLLIVALGAAYLVVEHPDRVGIGSGSDSAARLDTDKDGLPNDIEKAGWLTKQGAKFQTDPNVADTDGDGLSDGEEAGDVAPLLGPSSNGEPTGGQAKVYVGFSNPLLSDTDLDGLGDVAEADSSTNPLEGDSDGDQVSDGREVEFIGTDPLVKDTDSDGFSDGFEERNAEDRGLDPLVFDTKVSTAAYATDFAKGALLGDLNREDSMAWFTGNLASGGSSFLPGVGWLVGGLADIRDAVGSAFRGDWVSAGFSSAGLVPTAGDVAAISGKTASFVARNPELAVPVAAVVAGLGKVPKKIKAQAVRKAWGRSADELRAAGVGDKALIRLARRKVDIARLAESLKRPGHVAGTPSSFLANGKAGEAALEGELMKSGKNVRKQVSASTADCVQVCNGVRRIFDVVADGVAHEAKVGYNPFTEMIKLQIQSDAFLIKAGKIKGAHWHFYPSDVSGKIGADPKVLDLLEEYGIPFTIHLPK